ncbi:hypothetical protein SEEGA711_21403 [Salmonella enterica subsp. enterica serovar Gaminara str. ATCC BAA-711]|nr:hypothetical protein SEEN978_09419 [Salmonella enterica subsp. enterica serovar Newport str. CVM 37978]ESH12016.1 hypothetical protein SEEGA711_21403 [Salmonella enterica subsp. enterica serovar Gaminara str. ATCC BAA-711]
MPVYPDIYPHRFIFEGQQQIDGFLGSTGFHVAGDQLPFAVLFHQIFPFPTAFKIFKLLIFHCDPNVTV